MTNDKEISDFPERLRSIIIESGDHNKAFAKKCGVSEQQLYTYLKGASVPGMRFFGAMKERYPQFNIDWLISGNGEPTVKDQIKADNVTNIIESKHADIIRRFIDKNYAREINLNLVELERISPEAYRKVGSYIKGMIEGIQLMAAEPSQPYGTDHKEKADEATPPEHERRSGRDRRKP